MIKKVTMDYETRSESNLKTEGAFKYSLDPTTRATCLAFKEKTSSKVHLLRFDQINLPFKKMSANFQKWWTDRVLDTEYIFSAHNAFFERCIYENVAVARLGWPKIDPRRWRCTAAKAAAHALPRNLAGAGEALKLDVQKDKDGHLAVMRTCKPCRAWNDWFKATQKRRPNQRDLNLIEKGEPKKFIEPEDDPEIFDVLYKYCKIDVLAEERIDDTLADLSPFEQEVWFLNQKMNWNGLRVDVAAASKILGILNAEQAVKSREVDTLTMGLVEKPNSVRQIREFLALEGIELPDLKAKTVDDVLREGKVSGDMKTLLELRKELSKASVKKYKALLDRTCADGYMRDLTLYHGASTGRETGTGFQPHNLPRGSIKNTDQAIADILEFDAEMLKILYGSNLSILFSSVLRGMLIPDEGCSFHVADFSKVEVAVLWWLADDTPGLNALREGLDVYKVEAASMFGIDYKDVNDDQRQLGKAQVLGCGFGMGAPRFKDSARDMYRLNLSDEQSALAVTSYRENHEAIPILWKNYELAMVRAIEDDVTVEVGKCKFWCEGRFLWVQLPSGRRLAYADPHVAWKDTQWGPRKQIRYWAVYKGKHWLVEGTFGGKITENIVQAVARDLLMAGIRRLDKAGYRVKLTVHDEAIVCREVGEGSLDEMKALLCRLPKWAEGLPLESSGWSGPRYKK